MKLNLPVITKCLTVPIETLFETYKPTEVLGYCQQCNNYGNNHSCPTFDFPVKGYLASYKYVTLIMTEIDSRPIENIWSEIKEHRFKSLVGQLHSGSDDLSGIDGPSAVSMLVFNRVKDLLADLLIVAEEEWSLSLSSPPGSCTRCNKCSKKDEEPCTNPNQLRYSLEALGFLVSEIYTTILNEALVWSAGQLPKDFKSCSALFSKTPLDEVTVGQFFTDRINVLGLTL